MHINQGFPFFHQQSVDFTKGVHQQACIWIPLISPSFKEMGCKLGMCMERCNYDFTKWNGPYRILHFITTSTGVLGFSQHDLKEPQTLWPWSFSSKSLFLRSCLQDMGMDMDQNHLQEADASVKTKRTKRQFSGLYRSLLGCNPRVTPIE